MQDQHESAMLHQNVNSHIVLRSSSTMDTQTGSGKKEV